MITQNKTKINILSNLVWSSSIFFLVSRDFFFFSCIFFKLFYLFKLLLSCHCLVRANPQEVFSLSKNETSAVGGRPSAVGGRVGQIILGGRLSKVSSRRSTVGSRRSVLLANFFLSMISLIKNFSSASRGI